MKKVGSDDVPVTHGRTQSCLGGSVAARTAVAVQRFELVSGDIALVRVLEDLMQEIKSERHEDK